VFGGISRKNGLKSVHARRNGNNENTGDQQSVARRAVSAVAAGVAPKATEKTKQWKQ
jgi:hypothetical protein